MSNSINTNVISILVKNEEEKLQQIAAFKAMGIADAFIANINWQFPKVRVIDRFVYDENKIAHCSMCNSEVDVTAYTDEELIEMKKLGLCATCYADYKRLQDLKVRFANVKHTTRIKDGNKRPAGEIIRTAFYDNASALTEEQINKLTDFEFCKKELKLAFAFLLNVSACTSEADVKDLVKDAKGRNRWSTKFKYSAYGKTFCITNDLYDDKRHQIENFQNLMEKWSENPDETEVEAIDNTDTAENNDGNIDINTMKFIEQDAE